MFRVLFVSLLCAVCSATVLQRAETLKWQKTLASEDSENLGFYFALYNRNLGELKKILMEVSEPLSPRYGHHLSLDQVTELVAPEDSVIEEMVGWLSLKGASVVEVTKSRDWIYAEFSAGAASLVFNTEFCHYETAKYDLVRSCNLTYSLPDEISSLVEYVAGVALLPQVRRLKVEKLKKPMGSNDPDGLRKLYNIPSGTKATDSKNSQAVTGFLDQWYSKTDLQAFFKRYSPSQVGQTMGTKGHNVPSSPGLEANLDTQYIMAMGDGVKSYFWSDDKKNSINNQEPWASFLAMVANSTDTPKLFSMSYGDQENTLTKSYMDRVDTELVKLGTRGITMMSASGDDGTGCTGGDKFQPNFPGTAPHITSVGGTSGALGSTERAAGLSAGGFSNIFPRQSYQEAAVKRYLAQKSKLPEASYFNHSGRGYPDIAAVAENVPICENGGCGLGVSGTSCASPTFAGVIGLLNDARLKQGKSSLGFLNPLFYHLASGAETEAEYPFNDITEGASYSAGCGRRGWPALQGWDAVTGLGSPDYTKLVKAVMAFDKKRKHH